MDFLESAAVLIPALTGIGMSIYDGTKNILAEFERQYCFSPDLQGIYSAPQLELFLNNREDNVIYDLEEPLGSRLMVFKAGGNSVLLGPYVEEGWNESAARVLLTRLSASESMVMPYQTYRCKLPISGRDYVLNAALMVVRQYGGSEIREVRTVQVKSEPQEKGMIFPDVCHDISIINKRYAMEQRFISAVSRGETEEAVKFLHGFGTVNTDLRFLSDDFNDQLVGAAIVRTFIRMGAVQAGMSAVRIDAISQEYAQKMKHTASKTQLNYLLRLMVEHICSEVQKLQEKAYSPCVRKAMDYIAVNLSQSLTVAEIARAAGVDRHQLTRIFGQETGMTVKQYLTEQRCEIAAELLRDSEASVQDIAAYVGYLDNNYFSKVFKANQGVSPQSYQRGHRFPGSVE